MRTSCYSLLSATLSATLSTTLSATILLATVSIASLSITSSTAAAQPINELPFYGGQAKSADLQKLDADFVASIVKSTGSKELGAKVFIEKGFQAISKRDPKTAIIRFNQASLFGVPDYRINWGFGAALGQQGNFEKSIAMFQTADKMNPNQPRLLSDYGYTLVTGAMYQLSTGKAKPSDKPIADQLAKADETLKRASKLDPKLALPHSILAIMHFTRGDFAQANTEVAASQKLGGEGLDPRFVADLKSAAAAPAATAQCDVPAARAEKDPLENFHAAE